MNLANWIKLNKIEKFCEINKLRLPPGAREDGGMYAGNLANYLTSELGLRRANNVALQMSERQSPAVRLSE